MRRMYSEQELTKVIKEVFEAELASGALDEQVSDAVDAYLVENPVDITALEGLDISVGSLDADGLVTGAEIVEKMSGYSATISTTSHEGLDIENVYHGVVKTGNKITFVIAVNITRTATITSQSCRISFMSFPSAIGSKLYPVNLGDDIRSLSNQTICAFNGYLSKVDLIGLLDKVSDTEVSFWLGGSTALNNLTLNQKYYARMEATFLLNDNLVPEE